MILSRMAQCLTQCLIRSTDIEVLFPAGVNLSKNPGNIVDSPALLSLTDSLAYFSSGVSQRSEWMLLTSNGECSQQKKLLILWNSARISWKCVVNICYYSNIFHWKKSWSVFLPFLPVFHFFSFLECTNCGSTYREFSQDCGILCTKTFKRIKIVKWVFFQTKYTLPSIHFRYFDLISDYFSFTIIDLDDRFHCLL